MTECGEHKHDHCIVLRGRVDWETGAMIEGDLIRFTLANGTWIYRIGERCTINGEDSYRLRRVD